MKRIIAVLAATLAFSSAFALDINYHPNIHNKGNNGGGDGGGNSYTVNQRQQQIAVSKAESRAKAEASVANLNTPVTNQKTEVNVNEAPIPTMTKTAIEYGGKYEVKTAPAVVIGNAYPTTSCAHTTSVGVSWMGGGVGGSTSYLDDECGIRETSRSFLLQGSKEDALAVLCTSKYAAAAPSCKKQEVQQ